MPQLLSTIINGGVTPGVYGTGSRFSYSYNSYNPENSTAGMSFFDQNFCVPLTNGYPAGYNNFGGGSVVNMSNSTHLNYAASFDWVSSTSNYPSSNTTSTYMNATNACGEFGNACFDTYSDGTWGSARRSSSSQYNKHYLNQYAINSDHSNKRNVYLLANGYIYVVDRLYGNYNYALPGTSTYAISGLNSSMTGSASYNYARKELTILSYSSSGGAYNVITFQNVDFNLYPDPSIALTQAGVVRVNSTLTLPSWSVNNGESYYNLKPVVTANGTVYVIVFFSSSSLTLYTFTRSGTSAVTGTYQQSLSTTTSYGLDQGFYFGQRQITSRDGTTVAIFCPYYYYGSGIECFMIDKTNNTYSYYQNNNSGYGFSCVPFGNNGWAFSYNGNSYASNYTGGSIYAVYTKNSSGGFTQTGSSIYYPQFPSPNTTNYPALTPVTDYMLLPGNTVGPKLAG